MGLARRKEMVDALNKKLSNKGGKIYGIKVDLSKEEDILKAFEWSKDNVGPVSILINNAGVCIQAGLTNGATKYWKEMIDVNLMSNHPPSFHLKTKVFISRSLHQHQRGVPTDETTQNRRPHRPHQQHPGPQNIRKSVFRHVHRHQMGHNRLGGSPQSRADFDELQNQNKCKLGRLI